MGSFAVSRGRSVARHTLWLLLGVVAVGCGTGDEGARTARSPDGGSSGSGFPPGMPGRDAGGIGDPDGPDVGPPHASDGGHAGGDLDGGEGGETGDWLVPPVASCAPGVDACAERPIAEGLHATYRKDAYLTQYDEPGDPPTSGGRVHVAAVAAATGTVTGVRIEGVDPEVIYAGGSAPPFEWYHVWPREVVAGEPVWVAFHSRDAAWDERDSASLRVETTGGTAVDGRFPVAQTPAPLTYVTTNETRDTLLVHVQNQDDRPHRLARLWVDGRDVTEVACLGVTELDPGEAALYRVPLCSAAQPGEAWTVVAEWAEAPAAVGVGRILRPSFMVETWPAGGDCPLPGGDEAAFDAHRRAGFDTYYMYMGEDRCTYDPRHVANVVAPANPDVQILVGDDFLHQPDPASILTDTSGLAGFLTGDEVDGRIYEEGTGVPIPARKAADARRLWSMHPEVTTYNGAKTNRNIGSFAGMVDVQGIDFYIAACAPHITPFFSDPPLRATYDYLRNARDNHMPGPTWLYAQGLFDGWNENPPIVGEIHVQPDPQEILSQAMMVVAAGGKGLMWFQTDREEAAHAPARWEAIADANWMIRGVRSRLRAGDPTGAATGSEDTLVEAIRAEDALVVPVLNLRTSESVTDADCGVGSLLGEGSVPHWVFDRNDATVDVEVPGDLGVADVFEVTPDGIVEVTAPVAEGRRVRLSTTLDNGTPVRLFVLAEDGAARSEATEALAARP